MENVKIFVEGEADIRFIKQYSKYILGEELKEGVVAKTGGWSTITSPNQDGQAIRNAMKKNTDDGGINLIIFDVDDDFSQRQAEITGWKTKYNLDFELFLFPNNSDKGALEELLERIINLKNQPIFDCWAGYEKCISTKTIEGRSTPLTIPARKTKIYGYLETLLGSSNSEKAKIKEVNRNYLDASHWDLDSEYLNPLKVFLLKYLQEGMNV